MALHAAGLPPLRPHRASLPARMRLKPSCKVLNPVKPTASSSRLTSVCYACDELLLQHIRHTSSSSTTTDHDRSSSYQTAASAADELPQEESSNQAPGSRAGVAGLPGGQTATRYSVLNFYHLVDVPDPQAVVAEHRSWLEQHDIRGRIYISPQGINAQCGGAADDAAAYAQWVAQQPLFQGLRYSLWPAAGHTFPKLRLKYKPNLISIAGGMAALPSVTDRTQRATPVAPADWKRMIAGARQVPGGVAPVVLDVRNDYEWDAGHFDGAARPAEEFFNETPVGDDELGIPAPLVSADPSTPVLMYCTGGIRCDVYSAFLRKRGFDNLYTLEGGVQAYLREQGGEHWAGSLYVFDGRMAIPPGVTEDMDGSDASASCEGLPAAVPCQLCGSPDSRLPHMNCCNIDCNELFIACDACKTRLSGCCRAECMTAPRLLRPIKLEGGHYGPWVSYADEPSVGPVMATGRASEGRLARRARRREANQQRRHSLQEERQARKAMVREAMAKAEQFAENQGEQQLKQGHLSPARPLGLLESLTRHEARDAELAASS